MSVHITLPLFGGPGHELEENGPVNGRQLRQLGGQLNERLQRAAETIDKLLAAGWQTRVAVDDIVLSRAGVETADEATRRLRELGLDPEHFVLFEEPDESDVA